GQTAGHGTEWAVAERPKIASGISNDLDLTGIELLKRCRTDLILHQVNLDCLARSRPQRPGADWSHAGNIANDLKRELLTGDLLHGQVVLHRRAGPRPERTRADR